MQIKRVSYAYNSILEDQGLPAYMLDAYVNQDGKVLVDMHQQFKTEEEVNEAVEEVIPVLSLRTGREAEIEEVYALEVGGA